MEISEAQLPSAGLYRHFDQSEDQLASNPASLLDGLSVLRHRKKQTGQSAVDVGAQVKEVQVEEPRPVRAEQKVARRVKTPIEYPASVNPRRNLTAALYLWRGSSQVKEEAAVSKTESEFQESEPAYPEANRGSEGRTAAE